MSIRRKRREWVEAIDAVLEHEGPERAHYLIEQLIEQSSANAARTCRSRLTPLTSIRSRSTSSRRCPATRRSRKRSAITRAGTRWPWWSAPTRTPTSAGHIASYASAATLYDVGFNHFWHAPSADHGGDLVFVQGHSAPGVYARAFMLGRLTVGQMDNFRQEVDGEGISSYPHPWLMPDFWQFPTVSMGLGAADGDLPGALHEIPAGPRTRARPKDRKVWCFCGDGEMDEPESMGAIGMAAREKCSTT